jgi:hypothetical protein
MNDSYIEQRLIDAFLTLNDFSGIEYIKFQNGKPVNVYIANEAFEPKESRYFILTYLPASVEPAGLGSKAENVFIGLFQVDIITNVGVKRDEAFAKFDTISRLFHRGAVFGDIMVRKVYRAMEEIDVATYRLCCRIEVSATLPMD